MVVFWAVAFGAFGDPDGYPVGFWGNAFAYAGLLCFLAAPLWVVAKVVHVVVARGRRPG